MGKPKEDGTGNTHGDKASTPFGEGAVEYWVYGQNCGWWAITMLKNSDIVIPESTRVQIELYNGGVGPGVQLPSNQTVQQRVQQKVAQTQSWWERFLYAISQIPRELARPARWR